MLSDAGISCSRVIENLRKVPKGRVVSYSELAKASGTSARAVGRMMAKNRRADVACYKVVRKGGEVGGYSFLPNGRNREFPKGNNSAIKAEKIMKDDIVVVNGKIDMKKYGWRFR